MKTLNKHKVRIGAVTAVLLLIACYSRIQAKDSVFELPGIKIQTSAPHPAPVSRPTAPIVSTSSGGGNFLLVENSSGRSNFVSAWSQSAKSWFSQSLSGKVQIICESEGNFLVTCDAMNKLAAWNHRTGRWTVQDNIRQVVQVAGSGGDFCVLSSTDEKVAVYSHINESWNVTKMSSISEMIIGSGNPGRTYIVPNNPQKLYPAPPAMTVEVVQQSGR